MNIDHKVSVKIESDALNGTSMYDVLCVRGEEEDARIEVCASFDSYAAAQTYVESEHGEYIIAIRPPRAIEGAARAWIAFVFNVMSNTWTYDAPYTPQYKRTY